MNLPQNWAELVEAVRWAARDDLSLTVHAPLSIVMILYRKRDEHQLTLHLVNFRQELLEDIPVEMKIGNGAKVESITLISEDFDNTPEVDFQQQDRRLRFSVPELRLYDMLVIQLTLGS